VVERDLADSAAEGLSADWRMSIAYNAALQAATAALAAPGYRRTSFGVIRSSAKQPETTFSICLEARRFV